MATGDIHMTASATPASGRLRCDGGIYNVADYPDLFNEIGHAFGGVPTNPSTGQPDPTKFFVPNAESDNRYPFGASPDMPVGTYEAARVGAHTHAIPMRDGATGFGTGWPAGSNSGQKNDAIHTEIGGIGENRVAGFAVHFDIET